MNDLKRQLDEALGEVDFTPTADEIINKYRKKRGAFYIKILTSSAACVMIITVALIMSLTSLPKLDKITATSPQVPEAPQPASEAAEVSETKKEKNYSPTAQTKAVSADLSSNNNSVSPNTSAELEESSPKPATEAKENTVVKKSSDQQSTRPAENTPKKPEKKTNPAETENATQPATQSETKATAPTSAPNPQFAPEREDMYTVYFFTPESFDDKVQLMCIDSNQSYSFEDLQATDYNPSIYYTYVQKDKESLCVTRKANSKTQFLNNLNKSELCDDKIFVLTYPNGASEFGSQDSYRVKTRMYYYYGDDMYGEYPTLSEAQKKGAVYSTGKND